MQKRLRSGRFRGLGVALAGWLLVGQVQAITYTAVYMNDWSGCECRAGGLWWTDDQINNFDSKMASLGHSLRHKYRNQSTWASDLTEDRTFGGQDHRWADDSDMYVLSSHGSAPQRAGRQRYTSPMCKKGTVGVCEFESTRARFGERGGGFQTPNAGSIRYALLLTCFSVHTQPLQQWGEAFDYGLDVIMGYRGLSLDSPTTDEVPWDLASRAFGQGFPFKSAWFWATEDWWADDTAGIVVSGTTRANVSSRLDRLSRFTSRRPANEYHDWMAWTYHRG